MENTRSRSHLVLGLLQSAAALFLIFLGIREGHAVLNWFLDPSYRALQQAAENAQASQVLVRQLILTGFLGLGALLLLGLVAYSGVGWARTTFWQTPAVAAWTTPAEPRQNLPPPALSVFEIQPPPADLVELYLGQDLYGALIPRGLADMPPLLVGGDPRTGKTYLLASLLAQVARFWPDGRTVQMAVLEPKGVDLFGPDLPRLPFLPHGIANTPEDGLTQLAGLQAELTQRRQILQAAHARSVMHYRQQGGDMAYILTVIDEATVWTDHENPKVKEAFERRVKDLAARGPAFGLPLIVATHRLHHKALSTAISGIAHDRIAFPVTGPSEAKMLKTPGADTLPRDPKGHFIYRAGDKQTRGRTFDARLKDTQNGLYPFLQGLAPNQGALLPPETTNVLDAPASTPEVVGGAPPVAVVLPVDRPPMGEAEEKTVYWRVKQAGGLKPLARQLYGHDGPPGFYWLQTAYHRGRKLYGESYVEAYLILNEKYARG